MTEEIKCQENYSSIPISEHTSQGMSWNIDDRAYLQRMFCLQDEVTQKYISDTYAANTKLIIDTVKSLFDERNKEIFAILKDVKKSINRLRKEVKEHEKRLTYIEEILNIEDVA